MAEMTVPVNEISRGTVHDGPGIRTTVFTKGCALNCRWCQNPESISLKQEVWYEAKKCIGCFECVKSCPNGVLSFGEAGVNINREKCAGCGGCAEACPAKAITTTGNVWTADELVREVMKDKTYYDEFKGGVTVSGGEPLLHADFITGFFRELKNSGVHTALDTCGYAPEETLMKIIACADAVLYDIKLIDSAKHKELTGRENRLILGNLKSIADYIAATGKQKISLWIRTPLIPGETDTRENITQIADFIARNILDYIERWELCAFNSACSVKYVKMQKPWHYEKTEAMKQSEIEKIKDMALSRGIPGDKLIITGIIKQN